MISSYCTTCSDGERSMEGDDTEYAVAVTVGLEFVTTVYHRT